MISKVFSNIYEKYDIFTSSMIFGFGSEFLGSRIRIRHIERLAPGCVLLGCWIRICSPVKTTTGRLSDFRQDSSLTRPLPTLGVVAVYNVTIVVGGNG